MSSWRPPRKRTWLDLTPLIDVVFTLLLFVVVTAQFTSDQSVALNLPSADLEASQVLPPVTVTLTRDGSLDVGGRPVSVSDLGPVVLALLEGQKSRSVLLRADAGVSYSQVFELIAVLGRAGIEDVGLAYAPRS